MVSQIFFRTGFPLDDSWIHQTYARNLAIFGEWTFLPGEVSGGSTSPLWTAILSVGYLLGISPFTWAFGLGIFILWGIAYFVEKTIRKLVHSYTPVFPWIGFLIIFEWHFAWAAASGMETILFSAMVIWVLFSLIEDTPNYSRIGILIGISVWIRPDGLTLLGPAFMISILNDNPIKKRILNLAKILIGFGCIFSIYLVFSLVLAGTPWPTTLYAKQAEYGILSNIRFVVRLGKLALLLLVGIGSILLPGYILMMKNAIQKQKWGYLASFLWILGILVLYAWRLPVIYQHGRYVIPSMLVFYSFSSIGMIEFLQKTSKGWRWVVEKTWLIGTGIILMIFWGYGTIVYARDVAIIESEMVDSAIWVDRNIPNGKIIAAHDIGALGYFGNHRIIDMAGLISPEVIPFLHNEAYLAEFLDSQNVNYLMAFPDWYPKLRSGLQEIYSTRGKFAPMFGGENMVIYQWREN